MESALEMESFNPLDFKINKDRSFSDTGRFVTSDSVRSMEEDEFAEESNSLGSDSEQEVKAILDNPVPEEEYKRLE